MAAESVSLSMASPPSVICNFSGSRKPSPPLYHCSFLRLDALRCRHSLNYHCSSFLSGFFGSIRLISTASNVSILQPLKRRRNFSVFAMASDVGLLKLAQEDPSFHFSRDEEINQTVIEGMGELHLEIIVDRLKREFKVEANVGAPQVNYRESISKTSEVKYIHKKQSGGQGQFADITVRFEPLEPGSRYEFKSEIKGGAVPKEYIPGVIKGLEESMSNGVLAGFPVVDVRAVLVDGSYHDVDSSVLAFQLAARGAYREGMRRAGPKLLEPIMRVEVVTPEEHLGDVIGDLNSRRGQINSFGDKSGWLIL